MPIPLYFAFPDGVLHYVCAECTALCCRGHGLGGSLRREMGTLIQLYPALASQTVRRRGPILTIATPSAGCHFLEADHGCRIERLHGKALKPGVCTLFPFNRFRRIAGSVAVLPHFLCPLRLQLPARPGEVAGTHALLAEAVFESGLLEGEEGLATRGRRPGPMPDLLDREIRFRDACSAALGHATFAGMLADAAGTPEALETQVARCLQIWGRSNPGRSEERDHIDDLMIAIAPSLRLELLELPPGGILLALALAEQVAREVMTLGSVLPTLQVIHESVTVVMPAIRLLARGDAPMGLAARASKKAPVFGEVGMTFAAHQILRAASSSAGTLDILEHVLHCLPAASDRTALLVELGTRLAMGRSQRAEQSLSVPRDAVPVLS